VVLSAAVASSGSAGRPTATRHESSSTASISGCHRPPGGAAKRQLETLTGVAGAASFDDGALPAGEHVVQLLAEAAPGDAVEIEVDGMVGVHQEERDGLQRHQGGHQRRVDVADRHDEADGGERRRQDDPGERHDQQHRRHLRLTLRLTSLTLGLTSTSVRYRLDRLRLVLSAQSKHADHYVICETGSK